MKQNIQMNIWKLKGPQISKICANVPKWVYWYVLLWHLLLFQRMFSHSKSKIKFSNVGISNLKKCPILSNSSGNASPSSGEHGCRKKKKKKIYLWSAGGQVTLPCHLWKDDLGDIQPPDGRRFVTEFSAAGSQPCCSGLSALVQGVSRVSAATCISWQALPQNQKAQCSSEKSFIGIKSEI